MSKPTLSRFRFSSPQRGTALALTALLSGGLSLTIPACLGRSPSASDRATPGASTSHARPGSGGRVRIPPILRTPWTGSAPAFPLPKPSLPAGVQPGSPEAWGYVGEMVEGLINQLPSADGLWAIADATVQFRANQLYLAAKSFLEVSFTDTAAAAAAAQQLHLAAQDLSRAVDYVVLVYGHTRGPGPGIGPGPHGHPGPGPHGHPGPGMGGGCPTSPFWVWCSCDSNARWELGVERSEPWAFWWYDLDDWWTLSACG